MTDTSREGGHTAGAAKAATLKGPRGSPSEGAGGGGGEDTSEMAGALAPAMRYLLEMASRVAVREPKTLLEGWPSVWRLWKWTFRLPGVKRSTAAAWALLARASLWCSRW